jgi:CheY-like chemotaxis protein
MMMMETRAARTPNHRTGRRILVVDDQVDTANLLATLLTATGHETRVAHDGGYAIAMAREFQPEVILLDVCMPGMDGFEVARRLRLEPAGGRRLLVAVTGFGQAEDRQRSKEAGFDHYLVKPVSAYALEELFSHLAMV